MQPSSPHQHHGGDRGFGNTEHYRSPIGDRLAGYVAWDNHEIKATGARQFLAPRYWCKAICKPLTCRELNLRGEAHDNVIEQGNFFIGKLIRPLRKKIEDGTRYFLNLKLWSGKLTKAPLRYAVFRCRYLRPQACSLRSQRRRRRANFAQLPSGNEFERPSSRHSKLRNATDD